METLPMKLSTLLKRSVTDNRDVSSSTPSTRGLWRWFARCANEACPHRNRFIPSNIRKASAFLVEDRWFCGPGCAQEFLLYRVRSLISRFRFASPRSHRIPIGMLLVNRGVIDHHRLQQALGSQRTDPPRRLGEHLISLG